LPLRFYRVVRSDPPTLDDFMSYKAKGIPLARPDPEVALLWDGVSVNSTETQARNRAKVQPYLGAYIAELEISEGDPITFRRTGVSRGHYTLWGAPSDLLARVRHVTKV
jgi:hypothetical protein